MKNLDSKIKTLNENRGENSLYDYVRAESQSDPNFFRWLFGEEFDNDFDNSLTDDQREEFKTWEESLRIDYLFEKYIIVKLDDSDNTLKMTHRENFADCNFCNCYGDYGVKVGCFGAGCYSLDNSGSNAQSDCSSAIREKFNVCVSLEHCAGSWTIIPANENEEFSEDLINEIELFIKQWQSDNEYHTEVKAWTFHDSHNFKSIAIDYKDLDREPDCTELEEEEQRKILAEYTGVPYIEGATTIEETNNYSFEFTRYATDNWICEIVKK